jgi:Ni/Fe-hydrogenase subunit HybB-like protein
MSAVTKEKVTVPVTYVILAAIAAAGVVLGVIRLVRGLGPTTNLNSGYPWGMWIAFDVFTIPFSAVAFTMAAVVHIFNQEKYHGLSRLTVLAGFLGYLMVILVLIMDIGRWDQFYSVLMPWRWNLHSFMFEVAISITLYFGVLVLEMLSVVFEHSDAVVITWLKRLIVLVAAVGVLLSTVHQSSLGAVFVILRLRLHPLWWTPLLPLLFLTSALFTGFSVAVFLGIVTWRAMGQEAPMKLLQGLIRVIIVIQVIYLILKLGDLLVSGELGLIFGSGRFSLLFIAEMVVGVIVPLIIFASRARSSQAALIVATVGVVLGIAINRLSIAWFALAAPSEYSYMPYWMEWGITIAAICAAVLFYSAAVRYIPVLRKTVIEGAH